MEGPECDQQFTQVLLPKTSRAAVHQWLVAFFKSCACHLVVEDESYNLVDS